MVRHFHRSVRRVLVVLFLVSAALSAQPNGFPTGTASVGVPFTIENPFSELIPTLPNAPGVSIVFSFTLSGGSLPPGLTLKSDGLVSGTPTTPGQYNFTVTFSITISSSVGGV